MDCEECIFAQMGQPIEVFDRITSLEFKPNVSTPVLADAQVGCDCGRISTFEDKEEAYRTVSSPYYQLTNFCNMYRTKEWEEKQNEPAMEAALQEVTPTFGIALYDQTEKDMYDLQRTVDSILALNYQRDKIKVVLSTYQSRGVSAVANIINNMQSKIERSSAIFHVLDSRRIKDTEVFKKLAHSSYFVYIKSGATLPPYSLKTVDISLNSDLERIVMFDGDGFSIINKKIVLDLYLDFLDYDKMTDHIRHISQEQNVYRKI